MSNETKAMMIVPRSIDETTELAERLSQSSLLPSAMRGKMPDVLVTIMAGAEMGLPPMASLRAFHVFEGKPILSADGMVAIALGSGRCVYFERVEEGDTSVTYETLRVGAKMPRRCTWTIEMAKKAGLHLKDTWRLYPRAMLASRAKAELARDVYSDVLMGCHTADELGVDERPAFVAPPPMAAPAPVAHDDVIDAELVTEGDALLTKIAEAASVSDLESLIPQLTALKSGRKDDARKQYNDKKADLQKHARRHDVPATTEPAPAGAPEPAP